MPPSIPRPFSNDERVAINRHGEYHIKFAIRDVTFDEMSGSDYRLQFHYDSGHVRYPAGAKVFRGKLESNVLHLRRSSEGWCLGP